MQIVTYNLQFMHSADGKLSDNNRMQHQSVTLLLKSSYTEKY